MKVKILRLLLLIISITFVVNICSLEVRANEYDSWAGSIVDSIGTGNVGANNYVPDGVGYNKTGYLVYLLSKSGERASNNAIALHSPGYPGDDGADWKVVSRKGNYTASRWSGVAPWNCTPWVEGGSPTNEPKIRAYFETVGSDGVQNAFKFVADYFGKDNAIKFGNDEVVLVIEVMMKMSMSVRSNESNSSAESVYNNLIKRYVTMSFNQLLNEAPSVVQDAYYAGVIKEGAVRNCQTADYLGRFPQIISDGNTCHSLRSMRQKHIISGVTADYRGLISVQLWLD